ncbi:IQ domain-containing protein M isoform X2 [Heliangelus exortis]|uniref:IQ domain-containing protein M isoform X2 n=1 Tax=Heliangelus exortis TaxID=472823 RepID=UPI003A8EDF52
MISEKKWNGSVSSHQPALPYCSRGSAQTPVTAPFILENNANSPVTKAFGKAVWKGINQQESWLKKRLHKLPQRLLSVGLNPSCPKEAVKSYKGSIYPSPQCALEQEETISIMELLSGIDSVSRALENEKKENFSSPRSLDLPCVSPRPNGIPEFQITHKGKVYQDWRGTIGPVKEYSQARQKSMKGKRIHKMVRVERDLWRASSPAPLLEQDTLEQSTQEHVQTMVEFQAKKKKTTASTAKSERRNMSDKLLDLQAQKKVKKKGAHPEVIEASGDRRKHPSSREVLEAVICIQRYVRGWLVHRAFKRVKIKSKSHGPSLPAVVRSYRALIARVKHRAGVSDPSTPLQYFELEEWMDKKKFYESMFSKREFDKKMDRNDLPEFLRDCGYSISAVGIQRVFQMVCPASTAAVRSIKKHQAIEMAFTLYPPLGAKVKNIITVPLPWVHPIIDGREGSKKSALSRQKSKKTDFQVSAALVTSSMREWKSKSLL